MLSIKQVKAIEQLMQEKLKGDVAKEIGINIATLSQWFNKPEFQQAYDDALRRMLSDAIPDAVKTVIRLTKCGNPSVELGAAKTLLERSILLAGQRVETSGELTITVGIEDASD